MSDAEKVEPSASARPSHDGSNGDAKNAECNPEDYEQPENPTDTSWCLIDHPEIWTKPTLTIPKEDGEGEEKLEDVILRSERLKTLMNKPRNEIISLPDAETIADYFCCGTCDEIPFPWNGDPDMLMDEEDEDAEPKPFPETVFLCEEGHVVCRACAQSFGACGFEPEITQNEDEEEEDEGKQGTDEEEKGADEEEKGTDEEEKGTDEEEKGTDEEEKGKDEEKEDADLHADYYLDTDQYQLGALEGESNDEDEEREPNLSMYCWGESRVCLAPIDLDSKDFLLAKLIEDSEFACKYFYNWCSFRGRGKTLQDHEKNCDLKEKESSPDSSSECSGQSTKTECEMPQTQNNENSDDDAAILSFDCSAAVSEANDLIGKILAEHLSIIDLSSVSPLVLREHIPGWGEQDLDTDEQLTAENDLEQLELVAHQEENASEPGPC